MLEELAIQYVTQDEDSLQLMGFGLTVVGAMIAALVTRSNVEIARAPYLAYSALIFFAYCAVQIVWLQSVPAVAGGYLWMLATISLAASIAFGFFLYRIAMARSRDAYGHSRMAFLAFIPIANFWLLLTPSKSKMSINRTPTIPLLSRGLGVLTGFILLAAGIGVTVYIEQQSQMMEQQAQTEPPSQQAIVEHMLRSHGVEETLRRLAAESQTPIAIDELTTLSRIEATGTQLRRTYVVEIDDMTITEEFRVSSRNGICAWPAFQAILRAHGSIREVYVERSGREIGTVMVSRDECEW